MDNQHTETNLFREIETISIVTRELHDMVCKQNEAINSLQEYIEVSKIYTKQCENAIVKIEKDNSYNKKISYIVDYIIPSISIIGINSPIFWALGPKIGILTSSISFILFKK